MVRVIVMMDENEIHVGVIVVLVSVMMMLDLHRERGADPIENKHGDHQHAAEEIVDNGMAVHLQSATNSGDHS